METRRSIGAEQGHGNGGAGAAGVESEVLRRYAEAAQATEAALCCPDVGLDRKLLEAIPREVQERDYGCGDPSRWAREGDAVLDLGSGSGKACYMLAQRVGPRGSVVGADFNPAMLELARRHRAEVARRLGFDNVRFVRTRIQDLRLDLDRLDAWLAEHPVRGSDDLVALEEQCELLRRSAPAVADASVDLAVSNCVLNLVRPQDKTRLFAEIHRVLRRGGRAVISDVVCDEEPSARVREDPELWSGCIAGAWREDHLLEQFEQAGFYGVEILARAERPWQVLDGVEFRSLTVRAFKGKEGPCLERNQAVVYRGPWRAVVDDDGHTLRRGRRMAVCDKTYRLLTDPRGPYAEHLVGIPPLVEVPLESAGPFACRGAAVRDPRETKGEGYRESQPAGGGSCSGPECC